MAATGASKFGMNAQFQGIEMVTGGGEHCIQCHTGNFFDGSDYTGSRPVSSRGSFQQIMQTAQLRYAYEKDFRDRLGYGLLHDGHVAGLRAFFDFTLPQSGIPAITAFSDQDKDDIESFLRRWDTGMAPLVGAQFTLDGASLAASSAFLDLAEAQAQGALPAVDLILKGARDDGMGGSLARGAVFEWDAGSQSYGYRFDTGDHVSRLTVLNIVGLGLGRFTFTCVPVGMGRRLGIDQDEDGLFDAQETLWGTHPRHPDSDRDGFADGLEVAVGTLPTVPDAAVPDVTPPTVRSARALEIGTDVATFSATADEPVRLELRLGSAPGLSDLGVELGDGLRSHHDLRAHRPAGRADGVLRGPVHRRGGPAGDG